MSKGYRKLHRWINRHSEMNLHGGWMLCPCVQAKAIRALSDYLRATEDQS